MKHLNYFSLLFIVFMLMGCGPSLRPRPGGLPTLAPVSITVTQEGQPLADAQISLVPSDGSKNWFVGGTTDASGKVAVTTYGTQRGAPLGKYKVAVTKELHEGLEEYQAALAKEDQAAANKIDVKLFSCVEAKYGAAATSPLDIESVKGTKDYAVDVGKAVKELREFVK